MEGASQSLKMASSARRLERDQAAMVGLYRKLREGRRLLSPLGLSLVQKEVM